MSPRDLYPGQVRLRITGGSTLDDVRAFVAAMEAAGAPGNAAVGADINPNRYQDPGRPRWRRALPPPVRNSGGLAALWGWPRGTYGTPS